MKKSFLVLVALVLALLAAAVAPVFKADPGLVQIHFRGWTVETSVLVLTGGVLLNQKMTPTMLERKENRQKLEMMLGTFFNRLHGYHVQYNIVSRDTLIDAQVHPEAHKDLIVRVAGYSAFFNVLSRATQDDIIGRTEQTI